MDSHHTNHAPEAIGPYSQSVSVGEMLYTSGQIGLVPESMEIVSGGFEAQVAQVIKNLSAVLVSAGCSFKDVVKTTVYLSDMANFAAFNALYADAMGDHRPARSTIQAAGLPKGALVEIDLIARIPQS
jgi:2-iminobutanoate/2-iminopropanoate deaminase